MYGKRVFITGCGGMLGNAIFPYFSSWYDNVVATDKDVNEGWLGDLDVRDQSALEKAFAEFSPDVVLHLAAETDLEFCETHPETAIAVNAEATKSIAQLAEKYGATLIYISTAGVFDGKKSGFYTEADLPKPIMVYGQTKYDGELYTQKYCSRSFIVRAGWMMGGGREKEKKFIYKILQQLGAGSKELFAVDDKWGTPTYTYDFALNLLLLLGTKKYGTYHMVCEGSGTRFDVAQEILDICKTDDVLLHRVGSEYFQEEYFAPRPFSEMMINQNLNDLGINHMRHWKDALRDYIYTQFPDYIRGNENEVGVTRIEKYQRKTSAEICEDERRDSARNLFVSPVDYSIGEFVVRDRPALKNKAISLNISKTGACMYLSKPVEKNAYVTLFIKDVYLKAVEARVKWIIQEENGLYKAGVNFILPP